MVTNVKNYLMGFGVAIVILILVELILMVSGVMPLYERTDPSVGFSGYAPLFTKHVEPNGEQIFKTAHNKLLWFNPQTFPVHKAEGTMRIFCMGGSTTYGRPYNDLTSFCGWLRQFLPAVDPTRHWEVINAGGISYASYRVTRLMKELAEYEPDLFIVYSGHNEFLESRTYNTLLEVPEFVRSLGVLASHTRLYSVFYDIIYTHDTVLTTEVKPLLDNSVGPEDYHRDDKMRHSILKDFETSLLSMTNIARRAGAKMILVTPASNIRDFSPFKTEPSPTLSDIDVKRVDRLKRLLKSTIDEKDHVRAVAVAKEALALDDRDADLLYHYARALLALDRTEEARSAFIQARDEDICPLRALTPISAIVSDVAQIKNTGFVDFDRMVTEQSPNGIPGSELFLDHVHPTIGGNRLLALAIVEEMTQKGMVSPSATWNEDLITEISENLVNSLDEKDHGVALRNLSKVLAWAGKENEAKRLADLAVDIVPEDSEARHAYGVLLSKLGRIAEARVELEAAIRLDPNLKNAHYDLGIVLQNLGMMKQAETAYRKALEQNPNHAETYNNLGVVLAQSGNLKAAYENFVKALKIDPNNRDAASNLARARKALGR